MTNSFVFETVGIAYKQNPLAPELFAFVAPAEEIRKMSGVARKSDKLLTNYQRALDEDRVAREVSPFFKIPTNSSPTAIVLSIHDSLNAKISFEDFPTVLGLGIKLKKMRIEMLDFDTADEKTIIEAAIAFLKSRLSKDELVIEMPDSEEDLDSEPDQSTEDVEQEEELDLGESMLRELLNKLEKRIDITPDFLNLVKDMLKPSLVIDGQHRLFGAAGVEEGIPMLVCALVKPDWKEQVFQFTVINDKSVGIQKSFITSLAGMSLTPLELEEITGRLEQAGVQLWEVEVMQRVGYDQSSPFFKMINFNVAGEDKGLGYQTMKKIGRSWFEAKNKGLLAMSRAIYQDKTGKKLNQKSLCESWRKDKLWFEYFCGFWDKVKSKYYGTPVWILHSPLMIAVALEAFQITFLEYLESVSPHTIARVDGDTKEERAQKVKTEFNLIVQQFLSQFEERHFTREWGQKSLNHKDGRNLLIDYMSKVSKGSSVNNHKIFQQGG